MSGSGKRHLILLLFLCALYVATAPPFTRYMHNKPFAEKLGALPTVATMKFMSADQKLLVGSSLIMKVIIYYGGIYELAKNRIIIPPDYPAMSRTIHAAVRLDPYNIDAYYFAQAFLVWDVKQIAIANELLDYGMKYRTWDWYLPFFAGFNNAYFLKDYGKAAYYFKRAGELSGNQLSISLAGRYLHESGQTGLAIGYLKAMIASSRSEMARKSLKVRLAAFEQVRKIEIARDRYFSDRGVMPRDIDDLVRGGYLTAVPADPYGGHFYLASDGKVETSSQFAFRTKQQ